MARTIARSKPKATFRRRDKYLYVARTIGMPPTHVVAVCVFLSAGIGTRKVASDLNLPHDDVVAIKVAAEPFLRKPKK